MISFGDCEEVREDPIIVLAEKRSKITFLNPKRRPLRQVRVDDCVITSGPRCDYLLIDSASTEYYVELKGSDVRRAFRQLEATIPQVSADKKGLAKHCFIVSTRCPSMSPEIQRKQRSFKKRFNASLLIRRSHSEVDLGASR